MKKLKKIRLRGLLAILFLLGSTFSVWAASKPKLEIDTTKISEKKTGINVKVENLPVKATALEISFMTNNAEQIEEVDWSTSLTESYKVAKIVEQSSGKERVTLYITGEKDQVLNETSQNMNIGRLTLTTKGNVNIVKESGYIKVLDENLSPIIYEGIQVSEKDNNSNNNTDDSDNNNSNNNNNNNSNNSNNNTNSNNNKEDKKEDKKEEQQEKTEQLIPVEFKDITGHWAEQSIYRMASKGYIKGYTDNTYRPNANITRAEFCVILERIFEFGPTTVTTSPFEDVKMDKWYTQAILSLYEQGITTGRTPNEFAIEAQITNEEIATLIVRTLKAKNIELPKIRDYTPFKDESQIGTYALDAVKYLYERGIIGGTPDNRYEPKSPATRAQVATIFDRIVEQNK